MKNKIQVALTLAWPDWLILAQAWVGLLVADLGLRLLPFKQVQRMATMGRKAPALQGGDVPGAIRQLHYLVEVAARNHLYTMSCLRQSLVLQWLLGRRGIRVDVRIGVSKESGGLAAHAWVEYAGQPIGQPHTAARFAPLQPIR